MTQSDRRRPKVRVVRCKLQTDSQRLVERLMGPATDSLNLQDIAVVRERSRQLGALESVTGSQRDQFPPNLDRAIEVLGRQLFFAGFLPGAAVFMQDEA